MQRTPGPRHVGMIEQEKDQSDENEVESEKDRIKLNEYHTVDEFGVIMKRYDERVIPAQMLDVAKVIVHILE